MMSAWVAVASRVGMVSWLIVSDLMLPDHCAQGARVFGDHGVLRAFARWDSAHFLAIAKGGYVKEEDVAFYPLYPWLLRLVACFSTNDFFLILAGVLVSNGAFVAAAAAVERASLGLGCSSSKAVALAFVMNPASVFSSTCYSESLFAFFAFNGIAALAKHEKKVSTLFFLLAALTRSNGCLLAIFPLITDLPTHPLRSLLSAAIVAMPPFLRDFQSYRARCPGPAWCDDLWPSLYAQVQRTHWDVGLFRYWRLKQTPNFLLAAPAVAIAMGACISEVRRQHRKKRTRLDRLRIAAAVHCGATLALVLAVAHVEIATRLLAHGCLPFLWALADGLFSSERHNHRRYYGAYIISYNLIGAAAHSNFLPWT